MKGIIFDLDQTLINTTITEEYREKRQWIKVYEKIEMTIIYPGINEIINYCRQNNIRTAVVSSSPSPYCKKILEYHNIKVDVMICYHDTIEKKPDPAPILFALEKISVEPSKALSIGDRDIDIIASKAARVTSIACTWGTMNIEKLLSAKPDYIFNDTVDFLIFLKNWDLKK